MKVLVLNCGSSSLKFQLLETTPGQIAADTDLVLAHGETEKIGSDQALVSYQQKGPKVRDTKPILKHQEAIQTAFGCMTGPNGVIQNVDEIEGVGHRIVHGGERFTQSVLIDDEVLKQIELQSIWRHCTTLPTQRDIMRRRHSCRMPKT